MLSLSSAARSGKNTHNDPLLLLAPRLHGQGVIQVSFIYGSANSRLGFGLALSPDGQSAAALDWAGGITIRVYRRDGTGAWAEQSAIPMNTLTFSNPPAEIDMDGQRLIVADAVFRSTGSGWILEQDLGVNSAASAIDGDVCAVGANTEVHVFFRTPAAWVQEDVFALGAQCCLRSIDVDGSRIVVGVPELGGGARVEIFERSGTFPFATWVNAATIRSPTLETADGFGESVDLEGDRLIVGAPRVGPGGTDRGLVFEFQRVGAAWTGARAIATPDPDDTASFGEYVSLDFPYVAVGATPDGTAYLYELVDDGHFAEVWRRTEGGLHGIGLRTAGGTVVTSVPEGSFSAPHSGRLYFHRIDVGTGGTLRLATYCTGKANSAGCVPFITAQGVPSPTDAAASFVVNAEDAIPGEPGFLFYGIAGKLNLAFHGGTLCVKTPLTRLFPPKAAQPGGPGACGGRLDRGLNKRIQSGVDPRLTVGQRVYAQWFLRDPNDPLGFGDSLTDALTLVICD